VTRHRRTVQASSVDASTASSLAGHTVTLPAIHRGTRHAKDLYELTSVDFCHFYPSLRCVSHKYRAPEQCNPPPQSQSVASWACVAGSWRRELLRGALPAHSEVAILNRLFQALADLYSARFKPAPDELVLKGVDPWNFRKRAWRASSSARALVTDRHYVAYTRDLLVCASSRCSRRDGRN